MTFTFLTFTCLVLSLFNEFRPSEFNYYSFERLALPFLQTRGHNLSGLGQSLPGFAPDTCLDARPLEMDENFHGGAGTGWQ
jgi:hypothetical protein